MLLVRYAFIQCMRQMGGVILAGVLLKSITLEHATTPLIVHLIDVLKLFIPDSRFLGWSGK